MSEQMGTNAIFGRYFWKRGVKEYLPTLQVRQKWFRPRRNFAVGDIVLLMDQTMPRNCGPLGKVVEVNSG